MLLTLHESSPCVWIYYNLWKKKQLRTTYPTFFGQPRLHKSFVKKYKNSEQALDFFACIYGGRCPLWNLGSIVWWHTSAITCQIIMLTCQIFMSSCQIFMLTCKSLCWLVTYSFVRKWILITFSCQINAIQITTKLSDKATKYLTIQHHYLTSQHNCPKRRLCSN